MRSIVRKDSRKAWKEYTKKLAKKAGLDDPTDDEDRRDDGSIRSLLPPAGHERGRGGDGEDGGEEGGDLRVSRRA